MQLGASHRSRHVSSARPRAEPALAYAASHTPPDIVGRWQLVHRLAKTEWAEWFIARPVGQTSGSADYLVKLARADGHRELAAALLQRERLVASTVRHPHVQVALDGDRTHQPPYLVLANCGAMWSLPQRGSIRLALWRTRQIAAALSALHAAGWIHSRLAPESLLLSARGQVTLGDLGWSRRVGTGECRGEHLLAADLRYVAPEMLCDASELTPECDVYVLGLLLIELLIGRPAVNAPVGWQAGLAHLRGELADVGNFRADVPPALRDLLTTMISREPLRRPSAAEVERQLVRLEVLQFSGVTPGRRRWR